MWRSSEDTARLIVSCRDKGALERLPVCPGSLDGHSARSYDERVRSEGRAGRRGAV